MLIQVSLEYELGAELVLLGEIFAQASITPRRSIAQFAEEEIIVPSGPDEGLPFRLDRHPISRLLFEAIESGNWSRVFVTGPNQDGKTFMSFVIVVCYLLFELGQRVVLGVPTFSIAEDKWFGELLPVIERAGFKRYLPTKGGGARGALAETTWFTNGAALRVMTGGGDDQARAGFTSRNLVVTEVDGFDDVGSNSKEGTKFAQLEKRTFAFGDDESFTLGECTVSVEAGRTWMEYTNGTRSRIAIPCPHCGKFVSPGREHFVGWQDATSELDAADRAAIHCPSCGCAWTNEQRLEANRRGVLVHRGQEVDDDGQVTGDAPRTPTLGFRWDCVNSAVNKDRMRRVARQEWLAANLDDEEKAEQAEKDLRQAHWVVPAATPKQDVSGLEVSRIMAKTLAGHGRGVVPDDTIAMTLGADIGKYLIHWVGICWRRGGSMHVCDYDIDEVPVGSMGIETAINIALSALSDRVEKGWAKKDGEILKPSFRYVDAGYYQDAVVAWCAAAGYPWFPTKGYGVVQKRSGEYKRTTGSKVISDPTQTDHYALIRLPNGDEIIEIDADHWKSVLRRRIAAPLDAERGFTLYEGGNHQRIAKHYTAERETLEFVPEQGMVRRFEVISKNNHLLDATSQATAAGHPAGVRMNVEAPAAGAEPEVEAAAAPDGGWIHSHKNKY